MNKILFLITITLCGWSIIPDKLYSQNWEGSASFMIGAPKGDFGRNLDAIGFGLDLVGTYQIPESPVAVGLDFGFLTYGTTSRSEPFNPNIPEVTIRVRTSHNIGFGHFLARIQPANGIIRPYIDGLIGFNYLFTESTISDERTHEEIAGSTNFDDITLSGGLAAGLKFHLFETTEPESGNRVRIYLDLRSRYLMGGEADYLKRGSITTENGNLVYDVDRSRTDLLSFHIGFGARF